MSYVNGTTHYNLPQTTGTDKRDWSDSNQAFQDIDAALYGAVQDNAQAALDIEALEVRMDTAEQNIATNAGDISALAGRVTTVEGTVAQHTTQIGDVRTDLEDMICAYNEASATSTHAYAVGDYFIYNDVLYRATASIGIGDTIVPDTNCTTTNVATEIAAIGNLSDEVAALQDAIANPTTTQIDDHIAFRKYLHFVNVWRSSSVTIPANTATTIGTLPEGFRPAHNTQFCSNARNDAAYLDVTISTSGIVQAHTLNNISLPDFNIIFLI